MKHPIRLLCLSIGATLLAACGGASSSSQNSASSSSANSSASSSSSAESVTSNAPSSSSSSAASSSSSQSSISYISYSSTEYSIAELDDFMVTEDGAIERRGEIYTILSGGTYTVHGSKVGQIVVRAGEEDVVEIDLAGVDLSYGENSPIYIETADKVEISAKADTENTITDLRYLKNWDDETQGNGAIYAKCDLKLKGTGSLTVTGAYNNGVHTTKDLTLQKLTLNVTAPNNAIKGNDSITVKSGNIKAISTGGDGLKTEDSDISSKGNQRGTIEILDGVLDIYSACDGIDASYDALISGGTTTIHTNKYSSYTGEIVESLTEYLYIRTTVTNSANYRYAIYFYDDNGGFSWADASYKTSQTSGGGPGATTYYYYECERPANYGNFKIYRFDNSQTENSTTEYSSCSKGGTINTNYDCVTFSISGSTINTSGWTNYTAQTQSGGGPSGGPGGGDSEGNNNKSSVSAKGVKADNRVTISGGTLDITAADDGIHANSDVTLENGDAGLGDVTVSGGNITVASDDDGLHGDRYLKIDGGKINVTKAYEGLEGNQIYITGGESYVKASDDGVNAGSGSLSPLISISGGYLFAAVPSNGDTDGIDSNGGITITGGTVITCGPNSNFAASAFDAEGACSISGSDTTLLVFGGYEKSPSGMTRTSKSATFTSGKSYVISYNGKDITTGTLISSYSSVNSWSSYGSIVSVTAA